MTMKGQSQRCCPSLSLRLATRGGASAATAHFVYADHVNEAIERRGLAQEGDIVAKKPRPK